MRRLLVVLSTSVLTAGCADRIVGPAAEAGSSVRDDSPLECSTDAVCLDPVVIIGNPGSGDGGGGSGGGGDDGAGSDPGGGECMTSVGGEVVVQGCTGGGGEPEAEAEDSDICPQPLMGRTLPYLARIAGRSHEFQFTGTMYRIDAGRSPSTYNISGPTASKDTWWIAESGTIRLVCWGRWISRSIWLGTVVVQDDDLHFVMGPGHPDF